MQVYQWIVILLNFVVNFLLLYGSGRLAGDPPNVIRGFAGAAAGALYSGLCLVSGLHFLGNPLWRMMSLSAMALIAYGISRGTLYRGAMFAILSLALGGIASNVGDGGLISFLAAAVVLGMLCVFGFRNRLRGGNLVPVKICSRDACIHLMALQDTGNTLCDPVSGRPVLVISADAARKLTGLSREQLQHPVEAMGAVSGFRLIPYHTVGKENGLMLARKYNNVQIGKWKGSSLVAFAPEGLGGDYEALTGGTV